MTTTPVTVSLPSGRQLDVPDDAVDEIAQLLALAGDGNGHHPTVWQAIAAVMAEVPDVGKDAKAPDKAGGYSYRGIEAVTAALRKLCGRHGIVIYPITKITGGEPSAGMNPGWFDWRVEITWAVVGPDGSRLEPPPVTHGIGRDNSDKGINKAMTQAFKYLLLQLFLISDGAHDADASDYSGGMAPVNEGPRMMGEAVARQLAGKIGELTQAQREYVAKQWTAEDPMTGDSWLPVDKDGKPALRLALAEHERAIHGLIDQARAARPMSTGEAPAAPQDAPPAPDSGTATPEPSAATQAVDPGQGVPGGTPPGEEPF